MRRKKPTYPPEWDEVTAAICGWITPCTSDMPQKHGDWQKNWQGNSASWRTLPMPDSPTPGQRCYEAYVHAHGDPDWFTPWPALLRERQAIWETAAEAAIAAWWRQLAAIICGDEETPHATP